MAGLRIRWPTPWPARGRGLADRPAVIALYPNRGLSFVRGEGAYLFTRDGARYLDLMTNYGASLLGHSHPVVTAALAEQLGRVVTMHGSFGSDVRARASMAIVDRLPMPGAGICWLNSGTEAIEAALKFAIVATGRRHFVAGAGGYHGKTFGALSVTHAGKYRALFDGCLLPVDHVPFGSVAAVDAAITADTAAVIVEPIQGEGGIVVPPNGYLGALRDLCSARKVLLVVDEIQTGAGRTGRFTESEREGVEPDILCLGKGLAGGIPVGITAVTPAVSERLAKGVHTSTFGGNPLAAAGVLATLSVLTAEFLAGVERLGQDWRARLASIESDRLALVRGRGLMVGVVVRGDRDLALKQLQKEGVLAIPAGEDVIRFLPPLVVGPDQLGLATGALDRVLDGLSAS